MTEHVKITIADHVLHITLARPEKKNALTQEMYVALKVALEAASADASVRVVLLIGAPGIFCSGNDIADFLAHPIRDEDAPVLRFLRTLIHFEKPIVAGVAGMAVGIGTTMLLHCDYVVASEDAQFSTPFANLEVTLGTHEIVWRHPQLGERKQTVVVTAKAPLRIVMDFNK